MPGELAAADDGDNGFEEKFQNHWKTQVAAASRHEAKWAEAKQKPMKVAIESMAHLYQQCDLWASRSKVNEGKKAMMDCQNECVLLVRFIECSQLMLISDKHPGGKLSKEEKEQCKANLDSAIRRLEVAKPRLKQHLLQLYKEQLRRAAAANTTALGDALEGKKSTDKTSTLSSTPNTVVGDALLQEMLAAAGASKASQKPPPAHSFSGGIHPMHLPQPSSGSNGVGGGSRGSTARGFGSGTLDTDDDIFIAVPADDEVPNLLPEQNRMTWNTFMQHQRPQPGQTPHWHRPSPYSQAPSQAHYHQGGGGTSVARQQVGAGGARGGGGGAVDPYDAQLQEALRQSALMSQRENEKTARLKERLAKFTEYELEDVDNTGHCQFDAIAHQIFGRFANAYPKHLKGTGLYSYRQVRKDIATWLRANAKVSLDNGESISDFLDEEDGATWEIFCDNVEDIRMSPAPLWGNHLTLIAAANCYQRPIRVWSTAPGDDWWLQIEPKHYKASTHNIRPFELAHLYERHYLSVTERKGPKRSMQTTPL